MKKNPKIFLVAVVFALLLSTIAVLQLFHLHPQLSVGNVHAYWAGGSWTEVGWGTVPLRFPDGKTGIQKDYDIGPLSIAIVRLHAK